MDDTVSRLNECSRDIGYIIGRLSNTGGAGLGLSIAEEIIHLHGGKITASSQNETIDFVITLPLSLIHIYFPNLQ